MIEAELKARLTNPDTVRARLDAMAAAEHATYRDTYFDTPAGLLEAADRELRIRTIETPAGTRHLLTGKDAVVDPASGSKPEFETIVESASATASILALAGFTPAVMLTKRCANFEVHRDGRRFLATLVTVPELEGTFLEVETFAEHEQLGAALAAVRALLAELGVVEAELTTELYTDAVRAARR